MGDRDVEARLGRIEEKLDRLMQPLDTRFDAADSRLTVIDARFADIDARFDAVSEAIAEQRQYTEFAFDRLRSEMLAGFSRVDGRFDRLERKLDQFIDTQSKTNELVERRLQALESSRPPQ